jgi:hypothetical protein
MLLKNASPEITCEISIATFFHNGAGARATEWLKKFFYHRRWHLRLMPGPQRVRNGTSGERLFRINYGARDTSILLLTSHLLFAATFLAPESVLRSLTSQFSALSRSSHAHPPCSPNKKERIDKKEKMWISLSAALRLPQRLLIQFNCEM